MTLHGQYTQPVLLLVYPHFICVMACMQTPSVNEHATAACSGARRGVCSRGWGLAECFAQLLPCV